MTRARALILAALLLAGGAVPAAAWGGPDDALDAIAQASERYGVSYRVMRRVAVCESDLEPDAVGDYGHSHGLYQISDRVDTGLLEHFHQVTGRRAYDPYASAQYFARVLSGEFADVRPSRWTCWRLIYG